MPVTMTLKKKNTVTKFCRSTELGCGNRSEVIKKKKRDYLDKFYALCKLGNKPFYADEYTVFSGYT